MRRLSRLRALCAAMVALPLAVSLTACGSDNNDDGPGTTTPPPPPPPTTTPPPAAQRGDLLESPPPLLKTYAAADLTALIGQGGAAKALADSLVSPKCDVSVHQLKYQTVGAKAESATASGALMVPSGADAACQGARPIVLYAHGTSTDRAFNIAALSQDNLEGLAIAAMFAAQGYIVVAPNYVGYDTSSLTYHPFLVADQQSKEMIDVLKAARSALPVSSAPAATDNGKLFITGYSEGGYVAMATHRAMQAAGATVTAAAPMSGPYALSAFGDAIFQGQVSVSGPANLTLLISSYNTAYSNIFTNTTDVFEAKYATGINTLLPNATSLPELESQGKITSDVVFNSTPPDPAFAPYTPATLPANLASVFAKGFGTDFLISNAYRLGYLQDTQTAPDGGFPATSDGLPPANPKNTLRQALKTNDMRSWVPTAPVLLCGGSNDPTVFYLNTQLMQNYWTATAPTASVTVVNVDASPDSGDPYAGQKNGFQAAKDLVRTTAVIGGAGDNGDAAVFENYHAGLVAPFCVSVVKSFFDGK